MNKRGKGLVIMEDCKKIEETGGFSYTTGPPTIKQKPCEKKDNNKKEDV
jgi:hypothetical protein